ncbi:TPA: DUF1795 domain-containing protein [Salmonella enterica]|uniref:DcrB-related protein n=1 Tax=Salmonella enterica TaxID=28901 RepID=UPI00127C688E|nr:DUF1795 domain-containing protein [Salmonella enterica]EDH5633131.1 hypothetical protein [Salmonella enterica subsp. enterica serovar Claibornei]EEC5265559.1 DUF1795 domain-containing protein [Salmonella enterica subsp. enterica]EEE2004591.1 DUF1795 domain-containing protein [Salmonella enterica subsp. enterica serovar Kotte]EEF3253723.1 DUF1795 domain-containing protein [Salmonella enterica subsp. enterica serovar Abony]EEJ7236486.1 DUF1795 domain-containing protein [Salmonella enterica su
MTKNTRLNFSEGSIAMPEGFSDHTVNMLVLGGPENSLINLSITRAQLKPGETLSGYVDEQLKILKQRLKEHRVLKRETARLGSGEQAIEGEQIAATHKQGSVVWQYQAAFQVNASGLVLIFTLTSKQKPDAGQVQSWTDWLSSYVMRDI